MAGAGGLSALRRPLQILLNGPYGRGFRTGGLPKASMNLCAVAFVKQDRENTCFISSTWRAAENAQPNVFVRKLNFTFENCVATSKWKWRFPQSRKLLLVHHFDLLVDYLAGESIDRNMNPIVLFSAN
jgi:hypothetical protein